MHLLDPGKEYSSGVLHLTGCKYGFSHLYPVWHFEHLTDPSFEYYPSLHNFASLASGHSYPKWKIINFSYSF